METSLVKAQELTGAVVSVKDRAAAVQIRSKEDRALAVQFAMDIRREVKALQATEIYRHAAAAEQSAKAVMSVFRTTIREADNVIKLLKQKATDYDREVRRKAEEEARRQQAILEENARKERERMEKAAMKLKTESLREERLAEAAAIEAPTIVPPPAVERTQGETRRITWKARLVSMTDLIAAAANEVEGAHNMIAFDQTAANAIARATKGSIRIPGVEFWAEESMSLRV
jgi:hypothetical protein